MLNLSTLTNSSAVFSLSHITALMRHLFKILFAGYLCKASFHSRVLQTDQPSSCTADDCLCIHFSFCVFICLHDVIVDEVWKMDPIQIPCTDVASVWIIKCPSCLAVWTLTNTVLFDEINGDILVMSCLFIVRTVVSKPGYEQVHKIFKSFED